MTPDNGEDRTPLAVFLIFLRLGLTSFGGPIAHLGYFREEFVARRKWLDEKSYADLVALCQFLPGPASSQVGIALGLSRAGYRGAFAAWTGFTLPSAVVLILFALGISSIDEGLSSGALQGLKIVAVAVVAQAVWGMATQLCTEVRRITIMTTAACVVLMVPSTAGQVLTIIIAALIGTVLFSLDPAKTHTPLPLMVSRRTGGRFLAAFCGLLVALPILAAVYPVQAMAMIDSFFRAGSLVFGGGHVVLPLLQSEVVPAGWMTNDAFLAGYGAAQAVPGPLFTFSAYLGAASGGSLAPVLAGFICLLAIFAPSFLLVFGALPFWEQLRCNARVRSALAGVNAAVVGLLLAALFNPVWTSAIHTPRDFGLALITFVALMFWKVPPWLVVIGAGVLGWLINLAG